MNDCVIEEDLNYIKGYSLPYDEMRGRTVFVTGATGLVGSMIVKALLKIGGIRVIALVRNKSKAIDLYGTLLNDQNLQLHIGDILETINLADSVDYLIHCASVTASRMMIEKPVDTLLTSVYGTKNVLEFAVSKGCKSVVYVSSMEMYGNCTSIEHIIHEDDIGYINPLRIRSNYPESKRVCENMCIAYASQYGVPVKIARLAQTFGAGILSTENRVFAQFARSAMNGEDIVLHTEGKSEGNYCYLSETVTGLLTILLLGENSEAYNIVNPEMHTTIRDMARMVCEKFGRGATKVIFDIPPENVYGYAPDTKMKLSADKLISLGWKPQIGLEEAYRRMIAAM